MSVTRLLEENPIQELTWPEIRDEVHKVNPKFAVIVDELDPGKEYTVFKVAYPYGSEILKNGSLHLPDKYGQLVPLAHNNIDQNLKNKLSYNLSSNPVSMVLKNSLELFFAIDGHTIPFPYGMIPPGLLFGCWRMITSSLSHHPAFLWNMTAGARSIFMLPKIAETISHNRLKQVFQIESDAPKSLFDQWHIFKTISEKEQKNKPWKTEVLFFSNKWFEKLEDAAWKNFHLYLHQTSWDSTEFLRNEFVWDLIFSVIQKNHNIKPNPHIADTVKHMFAISVGAVPGFSPAIDDSVAPVSLIQKTYLEIYKLKNYAPIMMVPNTFKMDNPEIQRPAYYSLHFPTALEFSPKSSQRSSTIGDLYNVKLLLQKYLLALSTDNLHINETPLFNVAKKIDFDFFHTDTEQYYEIKENKNIPKDDPSFLEAFNKTDNKQFPTTSTFTRGCIRISKKDREESK